jgi:hypothetical protein
MIKHLLFYFAETTLITGLAWLGLRLAVNGLARAGVSLRPRWTQVIPALWLFIACINASMSELIGPEFTLHYYFGIWTLMGGAALWTIVLARQGLISVRARFARKPRAEAARAGAN